MAVEREDIGEALRPYVWILDASPLPTVVLDREGLVRLWNAAAERLLGWSADEVIGRPPPGIPESDRATFELQFQQALRGGTVTGVEGQRLTKAGDLVDVRLAAAPLVDPRGQVIGIMRTFEDVTERRRAEEALRAREQQLQMALQLFRMVAWEWDTARNVVTTTDNLPEIYGVSAVEMAEQGFAMIHPDDVERHRAIVDQAVAGGTGYQSEFRVVRPDTGAVVWMEERGTPVLDEAGNVQKLVGVVVDTTMRKRAEEAVRGQAALLDLTFDAILVRDFATDTIQFWNRGAEELYGFSRDAVVERVSHDVLQTVHPIPVGEAKRILVQTGRWEGELVHTKRDGTQIVVHSRWAVRMKKGQPVAILETNTDVTGRVRAERERSDLLAREQQARAQAEEAEQRLTVLAEASALLASSLDYETTLTSVAEAVVPRIADWCAVHLVDEEGTVHQIAVTHPDPAKVELARELERRYPYDAGGRGVPQVLHTGHPILTPEITDEMLVAGSSDPELLQIWRGLGLQSLIIVPLIARERILGAITLVTADSGRRYATEDVALAEILARRAALAVDNARLYREAHRVAAERSAILAQMTDGVILVDPNGVVTFTNDAAQRLYGRDFVGRSLSDYRGTLSILDPHGRPYPADSLPLQRALVHGEVTIDAEARLHRLDGTEVIVQRSATPITADDGTRLGAVLTVRDITAQRSLERQKEEFLSAVAHDLKTPLTSLKGLAQILQRRVTKDPGPGSERLVEGLNRIEQNAARMTSMINELLDLSRLQMGEGLELNRQPTDLVSLVRQCIAAYDDATETHPIAVESQVAQLIGTWDADRLERVIANLLSNAVKYSPQDTPIVVTVREEDQGGVAWASVSVEDHGIGIPADDLPLIFERFRRAHNVSRETLGTGIGLSGARQIVEQHGGTIEVDSEENVGSTFTVRLPLDARDGGWPKGQRREEHHVG